MSEQPGDRVQKLFDQAVVLPPAQRAAFLEAACGGDVGLRAEVESLLACDVEFPAGASGEGLLNSPLVRSPKPTLSAAEPLPAAWPPKPPVRVGNYRILRRIAEGGMGAVYEAEQESPRRLVALKVVRTGLASPTLVKRFTHEAQILGRLHHPGIAQVYEAGLAEDGQPFFAMEFIRGLPLDEYARRHGLDVAARVGLLARVCDAVQHAHDQGVIHRDLKPANILVDKTGQPKVLDFGVARATDADLLTGAGLTQTGQLLGTPNYMSPEQATADPAAIDQRADVYALGVILFELLAHCLPYRLDNQPLAETARLILEQDAPRLGSLNPELRGDVETVVAKALEKDPARRYQSAAKLAADLRRWLAHEPILARPSALYQLGKFARRHRPLVAAAVGVLAAVFLGAAVAVAYALSEREQRRIAEVKTEDERSARAEAEQKTRDERSARAEAEQKTRDERSARAEAERNLQASERHRQAARQNLYVANVRLARQAWEEAHVDQMRQLLDEAAAGLPGDEDLRGFEWHYQRRLAQPVEQVLRGQALTDTAVAYSPDGRRLASAGSRGTIRLWDATTGKELRRMAGPDSSVLGLAYSPDGRQLASAGAFRTDGMVRLWDAAAGRELRAIPVPGSQASGAAFSPDGRRLAVVSWNSPPGALGKGPAGGRLCPFSTASGETVFSTPVLDSSLQGVAFSPDGSRLASAEPEDLKAHVWDAATGREVLTFEGQVVIFSPDGRHLAAAHEDVVSVREAATGKEIRTFKGHAARVKSLAYSPDGKRLASCGDDQTVRVWEADTGRTLDVFKGHTGPVLGLAFSPDGRRLASAAQDHTLRIWQAGTGYESRVVARPAGGFTHMALSRDGERVATGGADGTVQVWDAASGAALLTLRPYNAPIMGLAFSADSRRLATAGGTIGLLHVWDVAAGRQVAAPPHAGSAITALEYSPDGHVLAAGRFQRVQLWDADTMTVLRDVAIGSVRVTSIAFRPDGRRIAAAGTDTTVMQGEVATGLSLRSLIQLHELRVLGGVAYSPDGRRLASACEDGTVQTWEAGAETDRGLVLFRGHSGPVNCVIFSPDGRRLATGGDDRTARVWDAATGKELLTLRLSSPVRGLAFSPLGDALFTHDAEAVRVWETWTPHDGAGPSRWLRSALAQGLTGDWARAREHLARAAAQAPDDAAVSLARSWVEARAGHPAEARAAREEAARVSRLLPLDAETGWKDRALPAPLAPERRRDAQEALRVVEQAERLRPEGDAAGAADFWRACGWARCSLRDWPGAAADFDAALFHDSGDWAARQGRARARAEEEKWVEADAACTTCLEARPENWECRYLRSLTRQMLGRPAEAVDDLTEALARGGDGLAVRRSRVRLCRGLGRWDLIVADATEFLKKRPNDLEMLTDRAAAYEALGRIDEAAADCAAAAEKAPNDVRAQLGLGGLRLRRQEWDQAADDFANMVQRHPGRHIDVEQTYARMGVAERAAEFYARLLRLRSDDMQVRHDGGLLAVRFSRWTEAAAEFATLTERQPNADANVWFEHACLRLLAGDREGCRKAAALMLKRGEEKKDLRPFLAARACTLAPLPAEDVKRAARLAEAELAQNSQAYWSLMQRGALAVRAGQPERAVPLLRQALTAAPNWEGNAVLRLWLALALHAQSKGEEARTELAAALETLDRWGKEMPTTAKPGAIALHVHDWLEAQILRREAEAVIAGKKADAPK